jgi:hypothetical protein
MHTMTRDDESVDFFDDEASPAPAGRARIPWKVLLVDDDPAIVDWVLGNRERMLAVSRAYPDA